MPVRSVLKCEATSGVCQACYGRAMATGKLAQIGDAVGIIAAQSIGEPGTQLTMRTFHTGGVAGADITHGLPRVVELFEARKPKGLAKIAEQDGAVVDRRDREGAHRGDHRRGGRGAPPRVPAAHAAVCAPGERIEAGKQLNEGSLYPHELLAIRGRTETEQYLVKEVQEVYKSQGVDINDKHIELIVRQMLKKVRVDQKGDTDYLPGQFVDRFEFARVNDAVDGQERRDRAVRGHHPGHHEGVAEHRLVPVGGLLPGDDQGATDAALEGKIDRLNGLKENVIIGKLIPAATGLKRYRRIEIEPVGTAAPRDRRDRPARPGGDRRGAGPAAATARRRLRPGVRRRPGVARADRRGRLRPRLRRGTGRARRCPTWYPTRRSRGRG